MSYIDIYRGCNTFKELQDRVTEDAKIAIHLESPLMPLVDAMYAVMRERGWSDAS